jgi:hypothetical protein
MYKNGRYQISFAGHVGSCIYGDAADTDQDGKAEIVACSYTSFDVVSWSLIPPLAAPVLSAPANSAVDQSTNINLQWNPVTGATSYKVQLTTDQTFTTQVSEFGPISQTSFYISGLAVSTTYYWRVNASNSTTSPWSAIWSFTTGSGILVAPVLYSPLNGAQGEGLQQDLIWYQVVGADSYQLQVSTVQDFTSTVVDQNAMYGWVTLPLSLNTTYYWHVRATRNGAFSEWSATWQFTTISSYPVITPSDSFQVDATLHFDGQGARGVIAGVTRDDHKVRVVVGSANTGKMYVYLYDGTSYQEEWSGTVLEGAQIIPTAIGDANNDGFPEIVVSVWPKPWYGPSDGKIHLYRWNGTAYAQVMEQLIDATDNYMPVAIADIDGDGKNELVLVDKQVNVMRYATGTGTFENCGRHRMEETASTAHSRWQSGTSMGMVSLRLLLCLHSIFSAQIRLNKRGW